MSRIRVYLGWLRRRPRQIMLDYKNINAIKVNEGMNNRIFYFGVPEHSNLGDLAQCYCIRRFLQKYFPEYTVVEVFSRNYLDNSFGLRDYIKRNIRQDDLIFFQSGYCTQDLGGREDFMHQAVIQDFPDNKLIMLPQTVYFQSEERRNLASRIYDAHKNLYFMARDRVSYEIAKEMFPHIKVECYPDIVTTLIGQYEYPFEREGVLFCIRNDSEKFYSEKEIEDLMKSFEGVTKCDCLDTTIHEEPDVIRNNLKKYIEDYFAKFAHYKLIITDRYHGTIFSLVSNTPVIVIQTKDHKVKTGVDWFREPYGNQAFFANTLEEAKIKATKILEGYEYKRNSDFFEREYYGKLRGKIEQTLRI